MTGMLRNLKRSLAAALMTMQGTSTEATEYYVSVAKGDDTRTEAQAREPATPWKTIQRAADAVGPGDTVLVQAGEYAAGAVVSAKGTAERPIVFRAVGSVMIRNVRELPKQMEAVQDLPGAYAAQDPGPVTYVFVSPPRRNLLVDQFLPVRKREELASAKGWPRFFHDTQAGKLYVKPRESFDPTKLRVVVSRMGIALHAKGEHITFDGFRVELAGVAVQLDGRRNTARRIWAFQCQQGVHVFGRHNTAALNTIEACHSGIFAGPDCTIRNNTVYGTRAYGLNTNKYTTGVIVNNIFWAGGVSGACAFLGAAKDADLTMDHNVWLKYSNRRGRFAMYRQADRGYIKSLNGLRELGYGEHSLQIEPGLVGVEFGKLDPRLRTRGAGYLADSPCINAGTPAGTDIGAHPASTPVPLEVSATKVRDGVRLTWSLPFGADTIIDGFYVFRRATGGAAFEPIVQIHDPTARNLVDRAGPIGCQYRLTSCRPGGRIQSDPSVTVSPR